MSLDISLRSTTPVETTCNCCGSKVSDYPELFSANITHNLAYMAKEADLYDYLWGASGKTAKDISDKLYEGLSRLLAFPDVYVKFNASNGWGKYEDLVRFTGDVYEATVKYPDAEVHCWS